MNITTKLLLLGCCLILPQFAKQVTAAEGEGWDYDKNGPNTTTWCKVSKKICCGKNQSPIDLQSKNATKKTLEDFKFSNYDKAISLQALNNGHTAVFTPLSDPNVTVSGGGLDATYKFHSFHFHWGKQDDVGSEHTADGKPYSAELHLVHFKSNFADLGKAVASGKPNALAVLGVFYTVDGSSSGAMKTVTDSLQSIKEAEKKINLKNPVKLSDLLPSNKNSVFRYSGSLTTPNCNEVVTWTVFPTPQKMSKDQMANFRNLTDSHNKPLVNNFRPPKALGSRKLFILTKK